MKKFLLYGVAALALSACNAPKNSTMGTPNTLTEQEKKEGWTLLFDGTSTSGWHTYGKTTIGKAWKVADGSLYLDAASKKDWQTAEGGDIVTQEEYGDFHLKLEWKIAPNGNSGIMFYVKEDPAKYQYPWQTGPEMQVLDNAGHPDAKIVTHRAGDLYDLISAKETVKPAGEWNAVEIVSRKGDLRFFLNGEQVLQTKMWDEAWRNRIANSKFKSMPDFGKFQSGRIALQDHGDNVWFRNIKIRRL